MKMAAMRKKLADYLEAADDKKVKAIFTLVENDIYTYEYDIDKDFIEELDRRSKSFADGTAKMYTWEETKQMGRDKVREKREGW